MSALISVRSYEELSRFKEQRDNENLIALYRMDHSAPKGISIIIGKPGYARFHPIIVRACSDHLACNCFFVHGKGSDTYAIRRCVNSETDRVQEMWVFFAECVDLDTSAHIC